MLGSRQALRIAGMRKTLGSRESSVFELQVPELALAAGELVAVVGDSGCGKSTLLDVLALVSEPAAVEAFTIDGRHGLVDVAELIAAANEAALAWLRGFEIGYILQTGGLLPFLSVRQNANLAFAIQGRKPDQARIVGLAERLGIKAKLDEKPARLSGGQRQRAAILRALANGPSVVLADEPTAAVDPKRAEAIVKDLCRLAASDGVAVLMVTHDRRLADLADRQVTFVIEELAGEHVRSTAVLSHAALAAVG